METEFSQAELLRMDWEDLVAQCISACVQQDVERAERIRFNDTVAKTAQSPPFDRAKAEAESYKYVMRMEQAINMFFQR